MSVVAPDNIGYSLSIDCSRKPGEDPVTITHIRDIIARTGAETLDAMATGTQCDRFRVLLRVPNPTCATSETYPDQIRQAFSNAGLRVIECQQHPQIVLEGEQSPSPDVNFTNELRPSVGLPEELQDDR